MKVATMNRELVSKLLVAGVMAGLVALVVSCKSGTKTPAPQAAVTLPPASVEPLPPPAPAAPVKADELTAPLPPPVVAPAATTEEDGAAGIVVDHTGKAVKGGDKKSAATGHAKSSYTVVKGDSLSKIAKKNDVTLAALAAANGMKVTDTLRIGKKLEIPAAGAKVAAHKSAKEGKAGSAKAPTAKKVATTKTSKKKHADKTAAAATTADAAAPAAAGGKYVVQKNDNPWTIAKKLHVKRADLLAANNLTDKSMLHIGQELTVPAGAAAGAAPAAAPAAAAAGEAPAAATATDAVPAAAAPAKKVAGDMAAPPAAAAATSFDHVVADGETLKVIADSYGVTVEDILKANPSIKSDASLKPNGTLVIPTK